MKFFLLIDIVFDKLFTRNRNNIDLFNIQYQILRDVLKNRSSILLKEGLQNQSSQIFFKIGGLKNFHRKTPVLESLFNKFSDLQACCFIKKRFHHKCFPVKFAKFLRTPFLKKHLRLLHLRLCARGMFLNMVC